MTGPPPENQHPPTSKHPQTSPGSRNNTIISSETFPRRPTSTPSATPSGKDHFKNYGSVSPDPDEGSRSETMAAPNLHTGDTSAAPGNEDIYDGPNDMEEDIIFAETFLSSKHPSDQQTRASAHTNLNTPNVHKRKELTSEERRRSERRPAPRLRPDILPDEDYDGVFSDNRTLGETLRVTIERDDPVNGDPSLEEIVDPVTFQRSEQPSTTSFRAPIAPMVSDPITSKSAQRAGKERPAKNPKTPRNARKTRLAGFPKPIEKANSTYTDASATKSPALRQRIPKLSMPSAKALAKPLGDNIESEQTIDNAFELASNSIQTSPDIQMQHVLTNSADDADTRIPAEVRHPAAVTDKGATYLHGASESSGGMQELESDSRERRDDPSDQQISQTHSAMPDVHPSSPRQPGMLELDTVASKISPILDIEQEEGPEQPLMTGRSPTPPQSLFSSPKTPEPHRTNTSYTSNTPIDMPAPTITSQPRAKSQLPFWVITRTPPYTEELWSTCPRPLSQLPFFMFLRNLYDFIAHPSSSGEIIMVKFTLRTPEMDTKITVKREADDEWENAMSIFKEKLMCWKDDFGDMRRFKLWIEPVWDVVGDGNDDVQGNKGCGDEEGVIDSGDEFEF